MDSAHQPAEAGDLHPVVAFSLLFVLPVASVALGWLVAWAFESLGLDPFAATALVVSPLLAGGVSYAACSARDVPRSTASGFAIASGLIAAIVLVGSFLALVSLTVD